MCLISLHQKGVSFANVFSGDLPCLHTPAQFRHIPDACDECDQVLVAPSKPGEIRLLDLSNKEYFVGAGTEFRGVGNPVSLFQGMDLTEVVGHSPVVRRDPNISSPAGCGLKVAGAFCKAFQALVLIHLYGKPKSGNLQRSKTAVIVK